MPPLAAPINLGGGEEALTRLAAATAAAITAGRAGGGAQLAAIREAAADTPWGRGPGVAALLGLPGRERAVALSAPSWGFRAPTSPAQRLVSGSVLLGAGRSRPGLQLWGSRTSRCFLSPLHSPIHARPQFASSTLTYLLGK